MTRTIVSRTIAAPLSRVFDAVADVEHLPVVIPDVVRIELLSDGPPGVGLRFRETRSMRGKQAQTELEVTELVENERVRMVADSHGTIWDSVFTVSPVGEKTALPLTMDAHWRPYLRGEISRDEALERLAAELGD